MIELNDKYVFHIPLYTHDKNGLIELDIDDVLDKLIQNLGLNGYDSFYMTKAKGFYKSRCFDELLITVFASQNDNQKSPDDIFKTWFIGNNDLLNQESFAYEYNDKLVIENLKLST